MAEGSWLSWRKRCESPRDVRLTGQLSLLWSCARMIDVHNNARGHALPQGFFWGEGCSSGQQGISSALSMPGMAAICMSDEAAMALAAVLTLMGPRTIPSNASASMRRRSTTR